MCSGSRSPQEAAQLGSVAPAASPWHDVGHEALVAARRPRSRPRPPRAPPGVLAEHGLDLAQLDAEAADLHLVVVRPGTRAAVRQLAHQVARAVQPRPGFVENGSGTKRSAVSSGRPR